MAGSYTMATHGWSLIENMGDAYEAVEEMLWLIESQIGREAAERLMDELYYPMCRGEKAQDESFSRVERMMRK